MKKGEVYKVHAPGSKDIHGRSFELVRQENRWPAGEVWVTKDVETGEEHHFTPDHFNAILEKEK